MDAAALHEPSAEGDALGGVVVPADDERLYPPPGELGEEGVEELYRLSGGDGFIVDIPGDEHRPGLLGLDDPADLPEDVFLILQHGELVDPLAKMEVGQMDEFHGTPLFVLLPPAYRKTGLFSICGGADGIFSKKLETNRPPIRYSRGRTKGGERDRRERYAPAMDAGL